jgi:transposase
MPKLYDNDPRKRIINLIRKGKKRKFISELLNISISTIDRLIVLYKSTGDIKLRNNIKTGRKNIIKDIPKFNKFVEKNKLFTLNDTAR